MNKKMDEIINNIKVNGGSTLTKKLNSIRKKSGFMVSLPGSEIVVDIEDKNISDLLREQVEKINSKNEYLGTWIDNKKMYIDISINIKTLKKALELGKEYKQLAIYDIKNDKVISL